MTPLVFRMAVPAVVAQLVNLKKLQPPLKFLVTFFRIPAS